MTGITPTGNIQPVLSQWLELRILIQNYPTSTVHNDQNYAYDKYPTSTAHNDYNYAYDKFNHYCSQ